MRKCGLKCEIRKKKYYTSRKGNHLDNSVMENFFGLLKTELFYKYIFNSVEHLILKIKYL